MPPSPRCRRCRRALPPALPTLPSLASDAALRGRSTSLPAAFRFGETAPGGGISWRAAAARKLGDPSGVERAEDSLVTSVRSEKPWGSAAIGLWKEA